MNGIYEVMGLMNEKFRAVGFNTITQTVLSEKDVQKQNIYPLMHITLSSQTFNNGAATVALQLVWADLIYTGKPLDPRTTKDVFSNIDNTEDIFHDLGQRINQAWKSFKLDNSIAVELPDTLTIESLYTTGQNALAGYSSSFTITIPATLC